MEEEGKEKKKKKQKKKKKKKKKSGITNFKKRDKPVPPEMTQSCSVLLHTWLTYFSLAMTAPSYLHQLTDDLANKKKLQTARRCRCRNLEIRLPAETDAENLKAGFWPEQLQCGTFWSCHYKLH
jgi:hypothetical protein